MFFGSTLTFAQTRQVRFSKIAADSELAEANVLTILQDKKGFMWFGTSAGLFRYDGYELKDFRQAPGKKYALTSDFIQAMVEGRNGDIWIATLGGGVSKFDRRTERFTTYRNNLSDKNSLVIDDVNTIIEDHLGQIWIGTNEGLDVFDPATNKFTHFVHDQKNTRSIGANYITVLYEDSHKNIWVGSRYGGLSLYNRKTKDFTHFVNDRADKGSLYNNDIHSIFEDSKNRVWIGMAENGLDMFDPLHMNFIHYNSHVNRENAAGTAIGSIEEDRFNNLWLGTENGGITIFNIEKNLITTQKHDPFDSRSLGSNSINTIYKGRKGNMWVGTFNAGVIVENTDGSAIDHFYNVPGKNSLSNNSVLSIFEDNENKIWLGTDGGGVNIFDPATGLYSFLTHNAKNSNTLCGDNVLTLCEDSKGNMWIGTWGNGISVYNKKAKKFKHYRNDPANPKSLSNNNAWKIFEDSRGVIWVGTYGGGLNRFDPKINGFDRYVRNPTDLNSGLNENWINSIFEGSDGTFYICTNGGGINILDRRSGKFTYMQPDPARNSLSNSNINGIFEDKNRNLWIATGGGLNYFNKSNGTFSVYTTNEGLAGNAVYGILQDENGMLWISTDNGISSFNPQTKTFVNLGRGDGLQSLRFKEKSFCLSRSGDLYFGGNNGFNRFRPSDLKPVNYIPSIVITSLRVDNRELLFSDTIAGVSPLKASIGEVNSVRMSYRNSVFTFSFASLNFTSREKKQYAYMLEGFDDEWHEVGTRNTATYTNLDPGTYIFKVRGLNNTGEWSDKIASISLTITPPFWLTWWFRSAVILFVVGVVMTVYFVRINAIKKQKRILEDKVEEQTAELKVSNKQERMARKEADRANEQLSKKNVELEQFVYIASHDLREPLRTTAGFVELLERQYGKQLDEKGKNYLGFITQSTARMRDLINDLLEYSRIGAEKEKRKVQVGEVIGNVLADLGTAITESNTQISVGPMPVIDGYPTAIKQLFQNLVANAIKFKKKDVAPQIYIRAEENTMEWKFSVADNGIGISEQHRNRIFMIFQRLHHRKEYEGSGIGLAHCKKIAEMHNGEIWVESTDGIGSTFYFTIPKDNKS